jgi:kynureninase
VEYKNSKEFANYLDQTDPLSGFRQEFFIPQHEGKDSIYLCGNSLGLQPIKASEYINEELEKWKNWGVEGHFRGDKPWVSYHKLTKPILAELFGAEKDEVVTMGSLTANLHFLLVSFYKPTRNRYKIITEAGSFPSDIYALETQVKYHNLQPEEAIIELKPRAGENTLRTEDILESIKTHKEELALVMFSGVQYYTGQYFNIQEITKAAHEAGAYAGFDLAHAAGNLPLFLHNWQVDFAAWCSYKYLNSGPGGMAGIFIHQKHGHNKDHIRFAGWWGYEEEERFKMTKGFKPMVGVDGWQHSNINILSTAAHRASLDIFSMAGIKNLRSKSILLTNFLEFLINEINKEKEIIQIITPPNQEDRGCQLSLVIPEKGKKIFEYISSKGVIADWREPDVIRIAPVPLYNTFNDVYNFAQIINEAAIKFDLLKITI